MDAADAKKLDDLFELREVKGKRVFIVDDHHKAFGAWALIRRELEAAPILLTFDHHTDTLPAYGNISARTHPYDDDAREALLAEMQAKLGWKTDAEVLSSIAKLKHDEHIDAAAICGVLRASFSFQLDDMGGLCSVEEAAYSDALGEKWPDTAGLSKPLRPFTYEPPEHNVFVVGHECFIGCEATPHTDDCISRHWSQILESVYVDDQLARAGEMARCIGIEGGVESVPYILDIDLDVFHTEAALEPKDPASFFRLIRGALAITIATEADFVDHLWWKREGKKLDPAEVRERALDLIARAAS